MGKISGSALSRRTSRKPRRKSLMDLIAPKERTPEWKEVEKTTEYKLKTPWAEYSRTTKKVPKEQLPGHVEEAEK